MARQRCLVTALRAARKAAKSSEAASESMALPAMPLANTLTMSLVEVSPSMLIMLNVSVTSSESACWSRAGETAASVVIKTSIVAMLG